MPDISFNMDTLHFIWDEDKNLTNIQKHGISFETAAFVFKDNLRLEQMDHAHSTMDEIRYITIGLVHDILTDTTTPCMADITDLGGDSMEICYELKESAQLSKEQIKEIDSARNYPYIPDEDSPEIDPEKKPELYEGFLKSLGERNRRLARQVL